MRAPTKFLPSGTSFPSLAEAAKAAGTLANPDHGYFAFIGKAMVFVKPTSNEVIFLGYLEHGKLDRLPVLAIGVDGRPLELNEWFDQQARSFNAYMDQVERDQQQAQ